MRFVTVIVVLALTLVGLPPESVAESRPDAPPGRGPYSVGSTFLLELDSTRTHQNGSARPIPIVVFYPVDPQEAAGAPTARYPVNPFANQSTHVFLSTNFEARGLDAAYDMATPSADGPFPLLVMSNGARQIYVYNLGIALRVASHGFVVTLMGHYGEAAYAPPAPSDPLLHVAQRGLDRILDMKFVIDRMLLRNTIPGDLLNGLIQADRIAVGGHSFGGLTSVQLTGGDDLVCDTYAQASPPPASCVPFLDVDTRVKAMVLLDPSTQNMHYHELARVNTTTILIGEDMASGQRGIERGDIGPVPLVLNARAHHAFAFSGEPNYRVDVLNSIHTASFTNACQVMLVRGDIGLLTPAEVQAQLARLRCGEAGYIPYQEANELVWRYAVSFLTRHLAGDKTYKKVLTEKWAIRCEPFAMFFKDEPTDGQVPPVEFPDASWFHTSQPDEPTNGNMCEGDDGP